MPMKLLAGVLFVVVGLLVAMGYRNKGMPASIDTLTRRVTDLEVQNVQLLKQLNWMTEQIEKEKQKASANSAKIAGLVTRLSKSIETAQGPSSADTPDSMEVAMSDNTEPVLDEYTSEAAYEGDTSEVTIVTPTEEIDITDAVNQTRKKWMQNLDSFAEQNQLDHRTQEFIAGLLNESLSQSIELDNRAASQKMKFSEYSEASEKMKNQLKTRLSSILDEAQLGEFYAQVLYNQPK